MLAGWGVSSFANKEQRVWYGSLRVCERERMDAAAHDSDDDGVWW